VIGWLTRAATAVASTIAESLEELRVHRGRVLLSLIGVAAAVCALATVVAAGAIAEQAGRELQERGGGRPATYSVSISAPTTAVATPGTSATEATDAAWRSAIERHDIEWAGRSGWGSLDVQFADGVAPVQVQVVDPDYGPMHRISLETGAWFTERDANRLAPAVIVNQAFWDRLGRPQLGSHPTVQVVTGGAEATAVVTGVTPSQGEWDTQPTAFVLTEAFLAMQPATTPEMGGYAPSYEMWLPEGDAQAIADSVTRAISAELGNGASVNAMRTDYAQMEGDPYLPVKLMVTGVAVVILLLGALGLVTISLVTVRARIREIGVRRSFGATAGRVFFAVLMESVVGTFVAGVAGVALAIVLVRGPLMGLLLGGADVEDLPGFPVEAAVVGIVAAVMVGALAGLLPALTAVRVKVIDAIRF
jgi:putative ABC transport system permease protein